jgi:TatD DNase family protein
VFCLVAHRVQSLSPMIDSHCHLADDAFAVDIDAVIERARAAGLSHGLCMLEAANQGEAARVEHLTAVWPGLRTAVGIHPHIAGRFAGRIEEGIAVVRRQLARTPSARAIGEIGLDYHYDLAPRDVQCAVFAAQVSFAREVNLPVIIHTREADDDTIAILQAARGSRGVIHCFTGDAAMARRVLDLNFSLSFAGILTFPRASELRETSRIVPPDRLLIETDSPYLAPVPYRGKRNEPAWVCRVLDTLAEVRGVALPALDDQVTDNFIRLFHP